MQPYQEQTSSPEVQPPLPLPTLLVLLLLLIVICSLIGYAIIALLGHWYGMDISAAINQLGIDNSIGLRNFVRANIFVQHLVMFILPAIIFSTFIYRKYWARSLHLHLSPKVTNIMLGTLLIVAAFPLAQFTFWLNQQIPLPDWLMAMEEDTAELIKNLLKSEAPYELYFNILVIALLPALGEEFIFRGIIQKNFYKIAGNPVMAIWLAAIIFSAIHMQFQGFLPRMLLGAILGYLFYWTGNLWIAIIAHFANNAFQIVMQYLYSEKMSTLDLENIERVPIWVTLISLIFVLFISSLIIRHNKVSARTKLT